MAAPVPSIGDWFRMSGGELFEVVALDDDEGTIDIQYFDGTVEEMDFDEWETHCEDRAVEPVDAPEDWSGSVDVDPEEDRPSRPRDGDSDLQARSLDDLDLFEAR